MPRRACAATAAQPHHAGARSEQWRSLCRARVCARRVWHSMALHLQRCTALTFSRSSSGATSLQAAECHACWFEVQVWLGPPRSRDTPAGGRPARAPAGNPAASLPARRPLLHNLRRPCRRRRCPCRRPLLCRGAPVGSREARGVVCRHILQLLIQLLQVAQKGLAHLALRAQPGATAAHAHEHTRA